MKPCVYTTLSGMWLDAASRVPRTKTVCFRSGRKWVRAKELLRQFGTVRVLFRQQDEPGDVLRCRFVADLVKINFREEFAADDEARAWLDKHLWLQRDVIKRRPRSERDATWQSQYKAWETDPFLRSQTWYSVLGVQEINPIRLSRLRKLDGGPLAADFRRGYALCHYPDALIRPADPTNVRHESDDPEGKFEGRLRVLFIRHRERERRLRAAKIRSVLRSLGRLQCEVPACSFDFEDRYGSLGREYAQVHHLKPLATAAARRRTTLDDLAIVCANCHMMIHRGGKCRPLKEISAAIAHRNGV